MRRAAIVVLLAACSRMPTPKDPTERALFRDLERQVTVAAATGWGIDRLEIDGMLESALDSVCRVDELGRRSLRVARCRDRTPGRTGGRSVARTRQEAVTCLRAAGPAPRAYAARTAGELTVDCPFWLEFENPFTGRQISENTWQLTFGGGGKASAIQQGDRQDLSFGGAGRLLIGRTFHNGDAVYAGIEFGASAPSSRNRS